MKEWDSQFEELVSKLQGKEPQIVDAGNLLIALAISAHRLEARAVDNETLSFSLTGETPRLVKMQTARAKFRMLLARLGVLACCTDKSMPGTPLYRCSGLIQQPRTIGGAFTLMVEIYNTSDRQELVLESQESRSR